MPRKHMQMIIMVLVCAWTLAAGLMPVGASDGFTIMADGTVDPPTAPVERTGNLYTITDDIDGTIYINRSEITLDGKSHTILGMVWTHRSFGPSEPAPGNNTFINMNLRTLSGDGRIMWIGGGDYNTIRDSSIRGYINLTGWSEYNVISENNFNVSTRPIWFYGSRYNRIFHNNFVNNTQMYFSAYDMSSANAWDDGYPSGGNYWIDYEGFDFYSGPYQNLTGSDGIGDTPYAIKGSPNTMNVDRYPLMSPWGSPDTIPPRIHILSPTNRTYLEKDIPLNFTLTESTSWIGYSLDYQSNVTVGGNTTLLNLPEGAHTVTVYANDTWGSMGRSETVHFTSDTMPPAIQIVQPENKTYAESSVPLNFTLSEPADWIGFSLDGKPNMTIYGPPNLILSGLPDGPHNVIVYATDAAERTGASERRYFTVDSGQLPYSAIVDWAPVAAAVVLVGGLAGLIGYLVGKRRSIRS